MEEQNNIVALKSTVHQFHIIKIDTIFTQQQNTNYIQVPIRHWNIPRETNQSTKISWSKGIEIIIIQSLLSYHCGIMLEINIKRYLKITHIFSSAKTFTKRDLAIKSLNKVRLKKTQRVISDKKAFK